MERSSTRAGVFFWTPAPGCSSSPPSPGGSQLSCVEGRDKDFQSQMDENGIIGLRESLEEMDDEEEVDLEAEEELLMDARTPEPEEGPPPALEDFSCHLSELLDSEPFSQATGDDCPSPSHNDESVALEDWSDDEDQLKLEDESPQSLTFHRPQAASGPVRVLSVTNDETEEVKHTEPSFSLKTVMDQQYGWIASHDDIRNERNDNMRASRNDRTTLSCSQNNCNEEFVLIDRNNVSSSPHFTTDNPPALVLSHFAQLSSEEQACNFGIKSVEAFPELGYTIAESHSRQLSCCPGAYKPVRFEEEQLESKGTISLGESIEIKEVSAELERNSHHSHHQPSIPSLRKKISMSEESILSSSPAQHMDKALSTSSDSSPLSTPHHRRYRGHGLSKPSHMDLKDVRKGQLSHPLPDFSKVEPKVRFPKSGYKPPRSRRPPRKRDSKLEVPLVFKSPADIVREVLLSSTEGLSDTAASIDYKRPPNSTLPEEFHCPLQASTLVQQLQDDYNRLLTKYAEAENTIDRLRLEAKVGLYSDLPKPTQPAVSGVIQEGSKVMTLSFPQAQRAEISANTTQPTQERNNSESSRGTPTRPSSVDSLASRWPVSLAAEQLTEALFNQVQRFHLQVDEFEDLLKSWKLNSNEEIQGLSQLAQGQDSLEQAYLAARDQYQKLQVQTRGTSGHFDPDRELEGLIFSSGLRLEELKERMEQSEPNQSTTEPGRSPPIQAHQACSSLNETEPQPKSPVSAVHAERRVGLEVSSASEESDGDREKDEEEIVPSVLRPMQQKYLCVEKDFGNLMNHYQNFRELPKLLDREICEEPLDSLKLRNSSPSLGINDQTENCQHFITKDEGDSSTKLSPKADSDSSDSSHFMETRPAAPVTATVFPEQQYKESRPAFNRTFRSSLEVNTALEKRTSKESVKIRRGPHQDGVISPETDSGFVGSESSRHTPAAQSPVQQRAAVRVNGPSVTHKNCKIKPETVSVSGQHAVSSLGHTHTSPGHSGRATDFTGRRGETGQQNLPSPSISSSPLRCLSGPFQPWPSSGISELEQQSNSAQSLSGEEAQQSDQYTQPANQDNCYLRSPSPTVFYHHGDNLKAQSSVHLTNRHEALQSLQEEVDRLREHLEGSLRMASPHSPVKAPSSVLKDFRNHKPSHTSTPQQPYFRTLKQRTACKRGQRENQRSEEEEERRKTPKPAPRRRSVSVPRFRSETDTTTDSEHIPGSPSTTHTSRRARAEPGSQINNQHRSISADRSEEGNDEAEGNRVSAPLCLCCMAKHGGRTFARPARHVSMTDRTRLYSRHCPLCGTPHKRVHKPAKQDSAQREAQPGNLTHGKEGGVYLAAAPPPPLLGNVHVIPCVPICPSVVYYSNPVALSSYKKPLHISHIEDRGYRSGVRGHHRRSHSVDTQHSLKSSLDRAIAAASSMREVSRQMARSLASGLQHTSPVAQSCTY